MPLSFRTSAHSEVGLVRKNNQDSAYVSPRMLMVADGMGGAAAGDLASSVAVAALASTDADLPAASETRDVLIDTLRDTLVRANEHLASLVEDDPALEGMGTTVCGYLLDGDAVAMVNIGDSRAYLLREGELRRVSHDHSWVQTLVDEGRITEEQALEHPHRSLIMRVLNGNPAHAPEFDWLDLAPGDRLLVCSDGLCGLVTDAAIAAKVTQPDREVALASLVDLAHDAGGHDNITIILADVVEGEPIPGNEALGAARTTQIPGLAEPTQPLPDQAAATASAALARPRGRENDRYAPVSRGRGRRVRTLVGVLVPLLVLAAGGAGFYQFTQLRYYLGSNPATASGADGTVAVFQGVPDRVLGFPLSHVVQPSTTLLADLPPLYAQRVRDVQRVANLDDGLAKLEQYRGYAQRCVAQRAARAAATAPLPMPTPTPTPTVTSPSLPADPLPPAPLTPGSTPGVTASTPSLVTTTSVGMPTGPGLPSTTTVVTLTVTPTPTPSPSPPQPTTPEDC